MLPRPRAVDAATRRRDPKRGADESGIPDPPAGAELAARVAELNRRLLGAPQEGVVAEPAASLAPVPEPCGDGADGERISVALMRLLRTRDDPPLFALLFDLNARRLHLFCRARLRGQLGRAGPIDACDVVAETFLAVLARRASFDAGPGATFGGWSIVIAANVMRQWGRRVRRSTELPLAAGAADGRTDDRPDPLERAIERETGELAARCWPMFVRLCAAGILRLPPRWRQAVELREGDGLSYREIGARMGVSPTYAGMLIRRARVRVLEIVSGALSHVGSPR